MIEREDFNSWLDNPITVHVFRELKKVADKAKEKWVTASWDQGETDPVLLADLRARAETINDLITVSYEDIDDSGSSEAKDATKGG